jgi:DNA-binding transcriptional LysR family regulator
MTFLQLRHFVALAQVGSFAKASKILFITQPALSRSIKALEEELGQLLFDRVGKKIELTPFGEATRERAQDLISAHDELKGLGAATATQPSGTYRLGLSSGPGALLSVELLSLMAQQHSQIKIEIFRANTQTLVQLLKDKRVDALVVDLRSLVPDAELRIERMYEFDGAFMCRADHPLLVSKKITFTDLRKYPLASTPVSDELARLLVSRYGEQAHPKTMVQLSSDEINDLVQVAQRSDTVILVAKAAGRGLKELSLSPALKASAKYGLVSVKKRSTAMMHPLIAESIDHILTTLQNSQTIK